MSENDIKYFDEREERADVLAEILRQGRPRLGITLIANIQLSSLEILGVRRVLTPEPPPDDAVVNSPLSDAMSPILRDIARDMVPRRTPKGKGWSVPDRELITVVCRNGAPIITHTDNQFFWGWRYSNHLTMAFDGDVYAVTPAGWVGLDGSTGTSPTFTADDEASGCECDVLVFPPLKHALMYPDDHDPFV